MTYLWTEGWRYLAVVIELFNRGGRGWSPKPRMTADNAPMESFFNSLKNEWVHGTCYRTRMEAMADVFDYIEPFYN